jgi:outer membrane lipoprotein-sorting protein
MLMLTRLFLLTLLIVFSRPGLTQDQDVQAVLDQLVQAYGGESNLRKMDSMVQEWDLTALMGNRHGTDTRSIRAPDQLRVHLSYPKKSETRILNGDSAFVIFEGAGPEEVSGMQRDAMRLQLMRLYSPLMLRDKISSVSLLEQGGLTALSLVENGVHVHYMVNKENWRIEKVAGSLMMNGNEIQFLTEYSDFAMIEGVLVHQKENKFASGMNTATLQLRKITFDASIQDELFLPTPPLGGQNISN